MFLARVAKWQRSMVGLGVAVSLSWGALPTQAWAQEPPDPAQEQALARYREGKAAYESGDYNKAIKLFHEANQIKPNAKLLLFIARAYDKKGDSAGESLIFLEKYAASGDQAAAEVKDTLEAKRTQFRDRLRASAASHVRQAIIISSASEPGDKMPTIVNPNVATSVFNDVPYAVRTQPPGASVYVDSKEWGEQAVTPDTFPLFPGRYKVIIEKTFYEPVTLNIEVQGLEKNRNPQFTELQLKRQQVPVAVRAKPEDATIIFLSEDGNAQTLGVGKWEGTLPAGPGKFTVRSPSQGEKVYEELLLLSQRDETGKQRLEFDNRKAGALDPNEAITGKVEIRALVTLGEVFVDGSKIGDSPGKLVKSVTPGTHEVEVRRAGFRPWTAKVELKGGAVETIETPEELVPLDDGPSWGGWIFTTLGVAGGGAGGYFTYLASQNDDADQKKMQETFSYIGYGVGGASLLTGILFFALGGNDDPSAQGEGQAPDWRLGAGPRPEGGGEVWLSVPLP